MKLMFVEERPDRALAIQRLFPPQTVEVVLASNPRDALAELADARYDLMVVDAALPGQRAFELCAAAAALPADRAVPVLLLVGEDAFEEGRRGLAAGAAAYVARTAARELLAARILGMVRRADLVPALSGAELEDVRILVIDDAPERLEALTAALAGAGAVVERVRGARAGIARFVAAPHDAVLVGRLSEAPDAPAVCRAIDDLRRAISDPVSLFVLAGLEETPPPGPADDFATERAPVEALTVRIAGLLRQQRRREALIQRCAEALAEADRARLEKHNFLAHMSHELRTPLSVVIGYSELLQEQLADAGETAMVPDLEKINLAGRHVLNLIAQILDLGKGESGRLELSLQDVDVRALITQLTDTMRPIVEQTGNRLEVRVDVDAPIEADEAKLRQSLLNLLSNACRSTRDGVIELAVGTDERDGVEHVWFQVRDTGRGMTAEEIARLFRPYVHADASVERRFGGTGLGLAITRKVCERLGGAISAESLPGKGSCFVMHFPSRQALR